MNRYHLRGTDGMDGVRLIGRTVIVLVIFGAGTGAYFFLKGRK